MVHVRWARPRALRSNIGYGSTVQGADPPPLRTAAVSRSRTRPARSGGRVRSWPSWFTAASTIADGPARMAPAPGGSQQAGKMSLALCAAPPRPPGLARSGGGGRGSIQTPLASAVLVAGQARTHRRTGADTSGGEVRTSLADPGPRGFNKPAAPTSVIGAKCFASVC